MGAASCKASKEKKKGAEKYRVEEDNNHQDNEISLQDVIVAAIIKEEEDDKHEQSEIEEEKVMGAASYKEMGAAKCMACNNKFNQTDRFEVKRDCGHSFCLMCFFERIAP